MLSGVRDLFAFPMCIVDTSEQCLPASADQEEDRLDVGVGGSSCTVTRNPSPTPKEHGSGHRPSHVQ